MDFSAVGKLTDRFFSQSLRTLQKEVGPYHAFVFAVNAVAGPGYFYFNKNNIPCRLWLAFISSYLCSDSGDIRAVTIRPPPFLLQAPAVHGFRAAKGGKTVANLPTALMINMLGKKRVYAFVINELITEAVNDYVSDKGISVLDEFQVGGVASCLAVHMHGVGCVLCPV